MKLSSKIPVQLLPTEMFTSRYLNNALNIIYERALRLIYSDYELPFDGI